MATPQIPSSRSISYSRTGDDPINHNQNINSSNGSNDQQNANLTILRERARKRVNEAVDSFVSPEEKKAYLEAKQRAPILVDIESDPLVFLRYCNYDVFAAAQRLCCYWTARKDIFGSERAYLPLLLSGQGALSPDDVRCLKGGFPAILPDTCTGKKVILCDRRQWITKSDARLRGLFHTFQVLAEDERTQTEGALLLVFLVTPRIYDLDQEFLKRALYMVKNVFPVKLQWHLLNWLPKTGKRYVVQDIITTAVSRMLEFFNGRDGDEDSLDTEIHIEREPGQLLTELQELGLTRRGIPFCVGGEWQFDEVSKWCTERDALEQRRYKGILGAVSCQAFSKSEENKESEISKKRLANVIHSRRKRERRNQEFKYVQNEARQLQESHAALVAENVRLESLWDQAQRVLSSFNLEE